MSGLAVNHHGLTDQELIFVKAIGVGESPSAAAELAGFNPADSWAVIRRPRVLAAVHAEVQRAILSDAPVSLKVLRKLRDSEGTPPRTRADIGIKLLTMAGYGTQERKVDDSKQLSDMSSAELLAFVERNQAEIDRLEAELAARAKEVSAHIAHQADAKPLKYLD